MGRLNKAAQKISRSDASSTGHFFGHVFAIPNDRSPNSCGLSVLPAMLHLTRVCPLAWSQPADRADSKRAKGATQWK